MLRPTRPTEADPSRERILVFGGYGAGKSQTWCDIAKWSKQTQSLSKFYVIDTDNAWDRMREGFPELDNVIVRDCGDWDEFNDASDEFYRKGGKGDWLIVDMIDKAWDWAQSGFSEKAFGKKVDEWFLEAKKAGTGVGGDYGSNWGVINRMYGEFFARVTRWKGHVLACAPAEELREPNRDGKGGDSTEDRVFYQGVGYKPKGQKSLGHGFHSVLYLQDKHNGSWCMTTVKDRQMTKLKGKGLTSFTRDYLVSERGWKV